MKRFFKLYLFLFLPFFLYSQIEDTVPLVKTRIPYIGLQIEPAKTSFINSEEFPTTEEKAAFQREFSMGFSGGIFVGFRFSKRFSLELPAYMSTYQQKFSGKDSSNTPFIINKSLSLSEVAIMPKISFPLRKDTSYVSVGIGPLIGFVLGASEKVNNQPIDLSKGEIVVKDLYNQFIFGAQLQVLMEYWLSNSISFKFGVNVKRYLADVENKKLKWFDPISGHDESYYGNYYKDGPVGIPIKEALGIQTVSRTEPTYLQSIGLHLGFTYYFVR